MSQDLKLVPDGNGMFDLEVDPVTKKYKTVDGFETAITTTLFTDARAPSERVNEASRRRGFVGDVLHADVNRTMGSILWTFDQSRITQLTLNDLRIYVELAFEWMIKIKAILGVSAEVTRKNERDVEIIINIRDIDNVVRRYTRLWRLTNAT